MRPPHYAGENALDGVCPQEVQEASMRPPHYAGENGATADQTPAQIRLQ